MTSQPNASAPIRNTGNLQKGMRLAKIGIAVNAALAVVKVCAGVVGHSYVLIADGIESALDVSGSLVIWSGLRFALKPPDETHPYGHGKAEPIAAVVVSLIVIVAALGLAVESVRGILQPHHMPKPFTLGVLVLVVIVKETLFRKVRRAGEQTRSTAVKADAWHHRMDSLTSAVAFIGISIALIGGKGWESADSWAALFACVVIGFNGVRIFRPALDEIMDTAPSQEIAERVRTASLTVNGVREIEQCKVRKMGVEFYVDLHVVVDGGITVREGHQIAHDVKDAVRRELPEVADVLAHVEPEN